MALPRLVRNICLRQQPDFEEKDIRKQQNMKNTAWIKKTKSSFLLNKLKRHRKSSGPNVCLSKTFSAIVKCKRALLQFFLSKSAPTLRFLMMVKKKGKSTCNSSKAANNSPAFSSPLNISNHSKAGGKTGFSYFSWANLTIGLDKARPINSESPCVIRNSFVNFLSELFCGSEATLKVSKALIMMRWK